MKCSAITKAGTPCKKGINTGNSVHIGEYVYYLCGGTGHTPQGYGPLNEQRRTKISTVAVIGDTHIDLHTGVEYTQLRLEKEAIVATSESIIPQACTVAFMAVKANGFKKVDGVKKFYFWHKEMVLVQDDVELFDKVVAHFQFHNQTKYILVRVFGRVYCIKQDLSFAEMSNCMVTKSRFS